MSELFEASSALLEALIRIETLGGATRCRLCFQHGFPEQGRVIEHLSTCPVGRVEAALIDAGVEMLRAVQKKLQAGDPAWGTDSLNPTLIAASDTPVTQSGSPATRLAKGRRKP